MPMTTIYFRVNKSFLYHMKMLYCFANQNSHITIKQEKMAVLTI